MSDKRLSSSRSHSSKRRETDEERAIRKEKDRKARENETEAERKIRKEKERQREGEKVRSQNGKETEEERRIRKEKESSGMRKETDEERRIRKEKESLGMRRETEEERRIRKEKERKERGKETEEERRMRKERERNKAKENEEKKPIVDKIEVKSEAKEVLHTKIKEASPSIKQETIIQEEKVKKIKNSKVKNDPMDDSEDVKEEPMEDSDDDIPLAQRKKPKKVDSRNDSNIPLTKRNKAEKNLKADSGEDSDVPLSKRKGNTKKRKADDIEEDDDMKKPSKKKSKNKHDSDDNDDDDFKPEKKSKKPKNEKEKDDEDDFKPDKKGKAKGKGKGKQSKEVKDENTKNPEPNKKMTKKEKELEEEKNVWKWWEEDKNKVDDGSKWRFLEHKGPLMAPEYVPLPPEVRFRYNGKVMKLEQLTEEVCTFYGKMLDHDYTTKEVFNKNFMKDWRKIMSPEEKDTIRDLSKCDFSEINEHFKKITEERKARSKEEKKAEKEANAKIQDEYGVCIMDGHQEKIGNYRVEPPGLFRGRGEHPKQGCVKNRLDAKDIIINCSKDSKIPQPPPGQAWKEIRHDNTVTWLASWTENIQGAIKYVMLNPSSKLKGEKDMEKYEKARELKKHIVNIRKDYEGDFKHAEMRIRQRAVALYFIDILALRAGNEKDDDQADTVGCCSLRVEHVQLFEEKDGKEYVIEFDFLGKDSIRYFNSVPVTKRVWKNVKLFKADKKPDDDLFDRLNTTTLNQYLDTLMPGLTAKVFRTYNASWTLQKQLTALTDASGTIAAKMLSYNRANRDVAVLCNHQRAVPKTFDKAMANLEEKIQKKGETIQEAEKELKAAKKALKKGEEKNKEVVEKKKKAVVRLMEQLEKLEIQRTDKDENKTIALGTSKLNYLDPRISVAWCKKHEVPIEKVYTKTHRQKFMWAINMAGPDYEF